ncbi:MAG: crosslink repair DNA glycosylase YcaQ family protein [Candidatus Limnocylindrales bacterium]
MPRQISIAVARRFLAIRHLLAPPRALPPTSESVLAVVDRLGSLQFDPLHVAGRNHDLVLGARIAGYRRELTDELLYDRRLLFEAYNKGLSLLPTRELPYYRITWQDGADGRSGELVRERAGLAEKILAAITAEGPRSSADFEREAPIDWWWGPTGAVRAVLEALAVSGRLGLARREGNRRYYDLTERLYPADLLETRIPEGEQLRHKLLSRYRGHGLLGAKGSGELWPGTGTAETRAALRRELQDRGEIVAVAVEGMPGERFVIGDELPLLAQAEREIAEPGTEYDGASDPPTTPPGCSFLAPLDPLMWDRGALGPLYGFEYRWEVYTPAAKRRWGYYVLPILFGDRLVGRIEPRIDRPGKSVQILGLAWEAGFDPIATPRFVGPFSAALAAYLAFAAADTLIPPAGGVHRSLFRGVAESVRVKPLRSDGRAVRSVAAHDHRATSE